MKIEGIQWDGTLHGISVVLENFPDIITVALFQYPIEAHDMMDGAECFWMVSTTEGLKLISIADFIVHSPNLGFFIRKPHEVTLKK